MVETSQCSLSIWHQWACQQPGPMGPGAQSHNLVFFAAMCGDVRFMVVQAHTAERPAIGGWCHPGTGIALCMPTVREDLTAEV